METKHLKESLNSTCSFDGFHSLYCGATKLHKSQESTKQYIIKIAESKILNYT